ncbi:MAG TPA: hypothetical protein VGM94_01560 [Galbitalea sp.]|jgi:hypothetical protein
MSAIGMAVRLKDTRPIATVVEAVGPRTDLRLRTLLVQPPSAADAALTLRELMAALNSLRLDDDVSCVVVRSINLFASTPTVQRTHHQVEGVMLAVSRVTVPRVEALDNQAIARICGSTWEETKASVASFETDPDASAAALAALILAGEA